MEDVVERCRMTMAQIMNVDKSIIKDDVTPDILVEWDSLAHTQLILGLEKEFSISIDPDEAIELESFKMVCDTVQAKINGTH